MRAKICCAVNSSTLSKFLNTLEKNGEFASPDLFFEAKMREYIKNAKNVSQSNKEVVTPAENDLVKKLMEKIKTYKPGQLAKKVFRELLELGIAEEWEIEKMQKASGKKQMENYQTTYGNYNKNNFFTAMPVLITEEQREFAMSRGLNQFYSHPLKIGDKELYLSAQWFERNLEAMQNWIKAHVTDWIKNADESKRDELKKYINKGI